ncbi:MAG: putative CRISPR-associated protein [Candidatus Hydrothermales bacterium]
MKKIITMVGTSIFENYLEEKRDNNFANHYNNLKKEYKRAKEWENERERCERLKNIINSWVSEKINSKSENLSAEIKSLIKLKEELKDDFEIYLLCSDTILSKLAGEIIKEILSNLNDFKNYRIEHKVINGLQIWDRKEFNVGMSNLIAEIYKIANEYWNNVIINITGGYKATVPYLTILAQVNRCPIYYIFEDTDALIKIPYIPMDINWNVFRDNEKFFSKLEKEEVREIEDEKKINPDIASLLEFADNLYCLNPLGVVLWKRYKSRFELFYISQEIKDYLNRNPERKRIFEKSILELKRRLREEPNHPDLNHFLKNVNLPEGYKTFKHKEENLQVRILYRVESYETRYGSKEIEVYIGLVAIGSEVHNAENEYVEFFSRFKESVINLESYQLYRIEKREV